MKKTLIFLYALSMGLCANAQGLDLFGFSFGEGFMQAPQKPKPEFVYDVHAEYLFDNREYGAGGELFSPSTTINAVRFTPSAGLGIAQSKRLTHKVMAGIDILKNMGENPVSEADASLRNLKLFREMSLYYSLEARLPRTLIRGTAGIFPRRFAEGRYPEAFISDSLRFYDNNLEGVLISITRPRAFYEIGCDWMGMYGSMRRERFMVFYYMENRFTKWLKTGLIFNGYHFANAIEYTGKVDNILLQPFLTFDLSPVTGLQTFSLSLSVLQGMQQDRKHRDGIDFPRGAEAEFRIGHRNIGFSNRFFLGNNMMPYYNDKDSGGNKYGSQLYMGDPFYRIFSSGGSGDDFWPYNRTEIYFQPRISDFLDLRLSVIGHLADIGSGRIGFAGWQQKFSLVFSLDKLLNSQTKPAARKTSGLPRGSRSRL